MRKNSRRFVARLLPQIQLLAHKPVLIERFLKCPEDFGEVIIGSVDPAKVAEPVAVWHLEPCAR